LDTLENVLTDFFVDHLICVTKPSVSCSLNYS